MIQLPDPLVEKYHFYLNKNSVPPATHPAYLKWLRFYIDFCKKFHRPYLADESLLEFRKKLESKKQTPDQIHQALSAVHIYFKMVNDPSKIQPDSAETELKSKPIEMSEEESLLISAHTIKHSVDLEKWNSTLQGLQNEIQIRHYSPRTLRTYLNWIEKFSAFIKKKPSQLKVEDVKRYLTWLAVHKKFSASSQNQAFNALLFFYRNVLKMEFGALNGIPRAKRRPSIPVVLSRREIDLVLNKLRQPYRLFVQLLYGCGLRLSECLNLRLQDLNIDHRKVTIHDGKGGKDRTLPLPESILPDLLEHINELRVLHEEDTKQEFGGVFLKNRIDKKYKNAALDFSWYWLFPAKELTFVRQEKVMKRHHLHETHVQKAIRGAVKRAKLMKRATAHTFRHSFASHLLQSNYDIRTIQELMGHSDIRTTMIYTKTVPSNTIKEAASPLDFPLL